MTWWDRFALLAMTSSSMLHGILEVFVMGDQEYLAELAGKIIKGLLEAIF
jgi:hypothetical protein